MVSCPAMTASQRFDAAYYRRHYAGRGRVHSAREIARLASGVTGLAAWLGVCLLYTSPSPRD